MATSLQQQEPVILDVRLKEDAESISTAISALRTQILAGLRKPAHQRTLPTLLLYDERGLRLYDELTSNLHAYYLFPAEEQILADHGNDIVAMMKRTAKGERGAVIVELGAGALRKTSHVLLALAKASTDAPEEGCAPVTYYALDLERRELLRTLEDVSRTLGSKLDGKVDVRGMWGTYDGGLAFIRSGGLVKTPIPVIEESENAVGLQRVPLSTVPASEDIRTPRPSSPALSESVSDNRTTSDSALFTEQGQASTFPSSRHEREQGRKPNNQTSRSPSPITGFGDEDSAAAAQPPLHFMFMGSTIGNFPRPEAAEFLKGLPLRAGSGDTLLLGLDHRNDEATIEAAYNDPEGYSARFALNGLRVAERILEGHAEDVDRDYGNIFKKDGWEFTGRWDDVEGRHEGYFKSTRSQTVIIPPDIDRPQDPVIPVQFQEGELISYEMCVKYSTPEALAMFAAANLRVVNRWTDNTGRYSVWLLERPHFSFPILPLQGLRVAPSTPLPTQRTPPSVPTLAEWSQLWSLWDMITMEMIPRGMLHQKPIDLRHKCLFYLGHIPAFLDIHLTRAAGRLGWEDTAFTEPEWFSQIFERGIDPHVDDPDTCHPHSEVPTKDEDWPTLEQIVAYRDRVRSRLMKIYVDHGRERSDVHRTDPTIRDFDRPLGRVLWMTWEHEAMHIETLLYMLLQKAGDKDGTLPPSGFVRPDWEVLSRQSSWSDELPAASTVSIGPADVTLGHDDNEADDDKAGAVAGLVERREYEFGWDNESPQRVAELHKQVKVETRPVLNGEYYGFWKRAQDAPLPASWVRDTTGEIQVRNHIPRATARTCFTFDELRQVRTLYGPAPLQVAKNWPFIGAYDEFAAYATSKGGRLPTEPELLLFRDTYEGSEESNIGFSRWHLVPPKEASVSEGVRGHNGGAWEWTSTVWDAHDGFVISTLYPGYSSDFFDTKHHTVLGGSYATLPRLAQRRSFRNWYQHNYPYAWIGGRVVYDA